jgi:ribosomal protein S18 acetylase RimI-like enzyme
MTIEIRRLGSADVALFENVAEGVFDHAIDRARLVAYLSTPGHHFIGAFTDGVMIGQLAAMVHRHPDLRPAELYVDEVGVAPRFQRQGIARRLVDAAFALAGELGCPEIWVATEPDNLPARSLYEARGASAEPAVMYVYRL